MVNLNLAKIDPASIFKSPHDVLHDDTLTKKDKIDILQRWAYDEREIAVAEEENMISCDQKHQIILDEILQTLLELGVRSDQSKSPPTKQG